jgi:Spy/CpxP family protein refolding chaperone
MRTLVTGLLTVLWMEFRLCPELRGERRREMCNRALICPVTSFETGATWRSNNKRENKSIMKRNLLMFAAVGLIGLGGFAVAQAESGSMTGSHRWHHHSHGLAMDHLTKMLNLTADQQTKVQPIVDKARPEIAAIHQEAMQKMKTVMDNTMSQIRPLLTADQQKKFDALQKARQDLENARQELRNAMAE